MSRMVSCIQLTIAVALHGWAATLYSFLDSASQISVSSRTVVLKNAHYSLFHMAISMYPRILSTFNEDLEPVTTSVRVGQAVDVVGQAGASDIPPPPQPYHHHPDAHAGWPPSLPTVILPRLRAGYGRFLDVSLKQWAYATVSNPTFFPIIARTRFRQAQDNHRFCHQYHPGAAGLRRARSACFGGFHSANTSSGRVCDCQEEREGGRGGAEEVASKYIPGCHVACMCVPSLKVCHSLQGLLNNYAIILSRSDNPE